MDPRAQTARRHAVLVMRALDREIRAATHDRGSLDDLARSLTDAHEPVTNAAFRSAAVALIGAPSVSLAKCP